MIKSAPPPTPAPMPAFAPVLSPSSPLSTGLGVSDAFGLAVGVTVDTVVVGAEVVAACFRMLNGGDWIGDPKSVPFTI